MRGRSLNGCRLQTDYASHECRAAFFDHCKKSGMDIRERAKPWEQEEATAPTERRSDHPQIHPDKDLCGSVLIWHPVSGSALVCISWIRIQEILNWRPKKAIQLQNLCFEDL